MVLHNSDHPLKSCYGSPEMTSKNRSPNLERIDRTILNSLAALFAEPDFDNDSGEIRFLDRDDRCVWLGLFPTDEEGNSIGDEPIVTWTIEVTHEAKETQS